MEQLINKQDVMQISFMTYLNQEMLRLRQGSSFGQAFLVESACKSFSRFLHAQVWGDIPLSALTTQVVCAGKLEKQQNFLSVSEILYTFAQICNTNNER